MSVMAQRVAIPCDPPLFVLGYLTIQCNCNANKLQGGIEDFTKAVAFYEIAESTAETPQLHQWQADPDSSIR